MSKLTVNNIRIVGTLIESRLKEGVIKKGSNAGKQYISGDIIVRCMLDGSENLIPVSLYSTEVTAKGEISKLFSNYQNLKNQIGRRLSIQGSFEENRFLNKDGEVVSSTRIKGRFINDARPNDADEATFEFGGFVARELSEKKNKAGETYLWAITLGQADYRDSSASLTEFHLDPSRTDVIRKMQEVYKAGTTININGNIRFVTKETLIEADTSNDLFGTREPKARKITNRYFYITNGKQPLSMSSEEAYTMDDIRRYKEAIASADAALKLGGAKDDGGVNVSNSAVANLL